MDLRILRSFPIFSTRNLIYLRVTVSTVRLQRSLLQCTQDIHSKLLFDIQLDVNDSDKSWKSDESVVWKVDIDIFEETVDDNLRVSLPTFTCSPPPQFSSLLFIVIHLQDHNPNNATIRVHSLISRGKNHAQELQTGNVNNRTVGTHPSSRPIFTSKFLMEANIRKVLTALTLYDSI